MGQSFSLGRISGIRIGVNWSVLLIVALLAYGLAAGQFPAEVADISRALERISGNRGPSRR
jgi:hypothetical protein